MRSRIVIKNGKFLTPTRIIGTIAIDIKILFESKKKKKKRMMIKVLF